MTGTTNSKKRSIYRNVRGITLVELIVVLIILAIMSTALVGSASIFLKRSTIQKNDSNAETIYQAAQTALQQMQKAGEEYKLESGKTKYKNEWIESLINGTEKAYAFVDSNLSPEMEENKSYYNSKYSLTDFTDFDASTADTNASVHMRYILTYSKNGANSEQSKLLKKLLQPYFGDSTVFQGTITLEFDVEKTADAYGEEHLSAKCLSVFYDSRARGGWSDLAYNLPQNQRDVKPGDSDDEKEAKKVLSDTKVPRRFTYYRNKYSLIGYYDGYKGTAVDTVYLPKVQEGIVVKKFGTDFETMYITPSVTPTPDPSADPAEPTATPTPIEEKHTRIIWAATLDKENLVGSAEDVYYRIALMSGTTVSTVLILNEDFLLSTDQIEGNKHKFDYLTAFKNGQTEINGHTVEPPDTYTAVYSDTVTSQVTKTSINVIAKVFVVSDDDDGYRGMNKDQISNKIVELPLRISYVTGELDYKSDTDHPVKDGYIEYSLDIGKDDGSSVLTEQMDSAVIKIYPNYFSNGVMAGTNDEQGIIAFKKGRSVDIEHEEESGESTP